MSTEADAGKPDPSKAGGGATASAGKLEPGAGRALMRLLEEKPAESAGFSLKPTQGLVAAAVALVLGAGFVGGAQFIGGKTAPAAATAQATVDPTTAMLHKLEDEVHTLKVSLDAVRSNAENSRQDEAIRGLKRNLEAVKQDLEVAKAGTTGAVAQLSSKVDKIDRDPAPRLAEISARLDKLDRVDKDAGPKLADLSQRLDQLRTDGGKDKLAEVTARLDRLERSISSASPVGTVAAPKAAPIPPVAPPGVAASEARPQPKTAALDGFLLRDVYGGVALVETRSGGLREVAPGEVVPGAGEIRSIERRGRSWVVVTSRGVIEADNRW